MRRILIGIVVAAALAASGCVSHLTAAQIQALGSLKEAAAACLYYSGPYGKGAVVVAFNGAVQGSVSVEECKTTVTTTAPAAKP